MHDMLTNELDSYVELWNSGKFPRIEFRGNSFLVAWCLAFSRGEKLREKKSFRFCIFIFSFRSLFSIKFD